MEKVCAENRVKHVSENTVIKADIKKLNLSIYCYLLINELFYFIYLIIYFLIMHKNIFINNSISTRSILMKTSNEILKILVY